VKPTKENSIALVKKMKRGGSAVLSRARGLIHSSVLIKQRTGMMTPAAVTTHVLDPQEESPLEKKTGRFASLKQSIKRQYRDSSQLNDNLTLSILHAGASTHHSRDNDRFE